MKKHIPNIITCCNLISGSIAVVFAIWGHFEMALLFIVIGAVFDFFDGMAARLLGVSSPIGKELDSLADDITFGLAPSAMVYTQLNIMEYPAELAPIVKCAIPFMAFIIAAFSALRLAKFNLDERQTSSFIGVPTPANALFWASIITQYSFTLLCSSPYMVYVILAMILLTSYLLVAEIPLFALKFKHWGFKGNEVKYLFLGSSVLILASSAFIGYAAIAAVIAWYVFLAVITQK